MVSDDPHLPPHVGAVRILFVDWPARLIDPVDGPKREYRLCPLILRFGVFPIFGIVRIAGVAVALAEQVITRDVIVSAMATIFIAIFEIRIAVDLVETLYHPINSQ